MAWADSEDGGGTGGLDPPGKSQVSIGFLRYFGTDLPHEAFGPLGSNCLFQLPLDGGGYSEIH